MKKRKGRVREVEREKQGQVAVLKRVVGGVLIGKVKFKYDFSGVSHPAGNLRKACFQLGQSWGIIFISGHLVLLCIIPDNVHHFGHLRKGKISI